MSSIANDFVRLARSNQNRFLLTEHSWKKLFFKEPFGNGEYIFMIDSCSGESFPYFDPDIKPKLVCIKVGGILYVYDDYSCGFNFIEELPEGVYRFRAVLAGMLQKVNEEILPRYLASLDVSEAIRNEKTVKYAKDAAIKALLSEEPEVKTQTVNDKFISLCDVAKILCGVENLENLALTKLQKEKELWTATEAMRRKTLEFMEGEETIDNTQRKIAEAVRSAKALRLTVEFNFKGKTGTAKIDAEELLRNLKKEDYFLNFNFATKKEGTALFTCLRVEDYRGYGIEGRLTYRNISKIMYRGKVIFEA